VARVVPKIKSGRILRRPMAGFYSAVDRAHLSEFGIVTPKACLRHDAKGIHSKS
jgi:hypothetical protein